MFNPKIDWLGAAVEGPQFRTETLVKGRLTQKEFLCHVQEVAISQVEEGDEIIMTVHVLEPEPMQIRKTTLAQQMCHDLTYRRLGYLFFLLSCLVTLYIATDFRLSCLVPRLFNITY